MNSQCLNGKQVWLNFELCINHFILNIYVSDSKLSEDLDGQCLNRIRLTAPLYILLGANPSDIFYEVIKFIPVQE